MDRRHYEILSGYLLKGMENEAVEYVDGLLEKHSKLSIYQNVITPAMYHIGTLWERNEITVADEHLATAVCDFIISRLEFTLTPVKNKKDKRQTIFLLGVEEEQHYIGLKMAASYFREKGWVVRYLGPNMPTNHALQQIEDWKPEAVGISAALSYRLPALKQLINKLSELEWKPEIIIGGRVARIYDLEGLETEKVHIIKDLSDLNKLPHNKKAGVLDETS